MYETYTKILGGLDIEGLLAAFEGDAASAKQIIKKAAEEAKKKAEEEAKKKAEEEARKKAAEEVGKKVEETARRPQSNEQT